MSQQADSIEMLYDFEGNIESGALAQFAAEQLPVPGKQRDSDAMVTPRYAFKFTPSGIVGAHSAVCPDGLQRYDMFSGTLEVEVYTHRSEDADKQAEHAKYRSRARNVLHGFRKRFGPDIMPFYEIGDVRETSSQPSVMGEDNIDATRLSFSVVFQIRPDAWPNM
jgi:hypothetical protein